MPGMYQRSQVAKELLQPHDIPEGPWRKLGIDYFAFDGNSYVLICDYFSKFPFLYRAKTPFWSLRDRLIDLFSIEGYPDEIVSDNRPPFQSKEFASFSLAWASSTPPHHQGILILMVSLSGTYRQLKTCFQRVQIHGPFRKS